jgi:hypothetical protein
MTEKKMSDQSAIKGAYGYLTIDGSNLRPESHDPADQMFRNLSIPKITCF